ncbi:MAG: hypothetical protein RSC65_02675 [Malacoplasma sp.]
MIDNFVTIYNNIIEFIKAIDKLNHDYKYLNNDSDRLANTREIDNIEKEIYTLENLLINDYENADYFLQVVNYKKWLLTNGNYIDNIDYLNKKNNLLTIICERVAYIQTLDKDKISSSLSLAQNLAQEKLEYERKVQMLQYEKELQQYELQQQQALQYEKELQQYELQQQQALEYERELQKYELEQQQAQEYERELQKYQLEQQQAQEYERELQNYEQQMREYENNIQSNVQMGYVDPNQMGYVDPNQMGYIDPNQIIDPYASPDLYNQQY